MGWWRRLVGARPIADPAPATPGAGFGAPAPGQPGPRRGAEQSGPSRGNALLPQAVQAVADRHRIVVLTREGCHLCDQMIAQVKAASDIEVATVDIDAKPEVREVFTTDVPVLIVDRRIVARWRIDDEELASVLASLATRDSAAGQLAEDHSSRHPIAEPDTAQPRGGLGARAPMGQSGRGGTAQSAAPEAHQPTTQQPAETKGAR